MNPRLNRLSSCAGVAAMLASACAFAAAPSYDEMTRVLNADAQFPEGPLWHGRKLYYVEYGRNTITTWDGTTNTVFASLPGCGPSAVVPTLRGEFLATCYDNGSIGRVGADGKLLPPYTHDKDGHPFVGPNDFAPDSHGGIYFTASGAQGPSIDGKVFYIAPDGTISLEAEDFHNANGIVVSRDGTLLYVVETDDNRLVQLKIGPGPTLSDRRVFLNLDELTHHVVHIYPDGVKIDARGRLFIGQSPKDKEAKLKGEIFVVDARGNLERTISLPSVGVPNFAFSPDQKTLYVMGVDDFEHAPFPGKVYAVPLH
ncbi:MAG TPA: SMP-30/gluconolactonase/LRE family protein [Steroidobacteraceae bacterium]|nr:SMP-30/gluconolactonase/LRE family protein [Steroidobacteraceae bacterium]